MSCENKLTNLIFKNKGNSTKTQFASFSFLFFIIIIKIKIPRMKCMNVMQCKSQKQKEKYKNQRTKNNGHKGKSNKVQGPCQKDSIRSSLLHSKPFRCITSIGVCIHIRVISNSRIGIKLENLYQFTNKCYRILCLWHRHFWLICSLTNLQLVTVWMNVSRLPTRMTNPSRLTMHLVLRKGRLIRFRLFQINPNLPRW